MDRFDSMAYISFANDSCERPSGDPTRPHESRRTGSQHSPELPTDKPAPAIPPRNHRSTLARIPATHPTPPDANGIRLQSNRSGIISSIALRAFKTILPFAVVL